MFFEHIFQTLAFLTVFALFPAFSTSHIFCDSLRFFKPLSTSFEYHEEVFTSYHPFLMLLTYFFRSTYDILINEIDKINDIDRMDDRWDGDDR